MTRGQVTLFAERMESLALEEETFAQHIQNDDDVRSHDDARRGKRRRRKSTTQRGVPQHRLLHRTMPHLRQFYEKVVRRFFEPG
ncbi:hypothetical protein LINPERHAP1_LOCUS22041, partial [Linum perenne]